MGINDVVLKILEKTRVTEDTFKHLFDSIRNTTLASLVAWAGWWLYYKYPEFPLGSEPILGSYIVRIILKFSGVVLLIIGCILFIINFSHYLHKVMESEQPELTKISIYVVFYISIVGFFIALYLSRR